VNILVLGLRGSGKTTLIRSLQRAVSGAEPPPPTPQTAFLQASPLLAPDGSPTGITLWEMPGVECGWYRGGKLDAVVREGAGRGGGGRMHAVLFCIPAPLLDGGVGRGWQGAVGSVIARIVQLSREDPFGRRECGRPPDSAALRFRVIPDEATIPLLCLLQTSARWWC
jgi:energy-coupling factor transporter ATP-binding protein EcfA2